MRGCIARKMDDSGAMTFTSLHSCAAEEDEGGIDRLNLGSDPDNVMVIGNELVPDSANVNTDDLSSTERYGRY